MSDKTGRWIELEDKVTWVPYSLPVRLNKTRVDNVLYTRIIISGLPDQIVLQSISDVKKVIDSSYGNQESKESKERSKS